MKIKSRVDTGNEKKREEEGARKKEGKRREVKGRRRCRATLSPAVPPYLLIAPAATAAQRLASRSFVYIQNER